MMAESKRRETQFGTAAIAAGRATESWRDRVLLARVGDRVIGFPAPWVAEILVIDRSRVMPLPFYDATVLGVIHHQGRLVTLADGHRLLLDASQPQAIASDQLTVMAMGAAAPQLAGVGITVDRVLGSEFAASNSSESDAEMSWQVLATDAIDPRLWQPLRWQPSDSLD
ncbi:MAG: chemotaxis protein CheW [Cyanobacteria bacterium J06648_11]